jgi:nucleoside-diphosphate-sugar epimerase
MRVFLAGGTGAIGRRLIPLLIEDGNEVTALTRKRESVADLEAQGVSAALADAFDRQALTEAILAAEPEIVIHELTAIPPDLNPKTLDRQFATTNRLRTEVTDTILAAAERAGARRVIAQSFCGWPYERRGGPVKSEEDPFDPTPPESFRETLSAIRYLEDAVRNATGVEGVALRYGFLYGPGNAISIDGAVGEAVRERKMPVVGAGGGIWSFIHVDDAARATVAAMRNGAPGVYNIVDDEPAPVAEWLPSLAAALGARGPRRVPAWVARFAIGEGGVAMMTEIRGASNAKAKRELDWEPGFSSWRVGFIEGL